MNGAHAYALLFHPKAVRSPGNRQIGVPFTNAPGVLLALSELMTMPGSLMLAESQVHFTLTAKLHSTSS